MSVPFTIARPARRVGRAVSALLALALGAGVFGVLPAQAAGQRVALRVLVVTSGDPVTTALAAQLTREGVPYTTVDLRSSTRSAVDAAFLEDAAAGTARFQAVILPNQAGGGLAAAELAALETYQRAYGIRQVNGYDYPGAGMGMAAPTYAGPLDGAQLTVTPEGKTGPFGYLKGSLAIEDIDPTVIETYGYLAAPAATQVVGQSFTPLLSAGLGAHAGVLAGVFNDNGREQLVLPAAYNEYMQWFNAIAPGIVDWATRGIHLGYQRSYFAVHIDDVLMADSRWSVTGNCTPGDDCVDPAVQTTDIRMTAADVDRLRAWQNARGMKLDLAFNAAGSVTAGAGDPLTAALLGSKAEFPWINHTYSHQHLGCIQIAPTVAGQTWRCATSSTDAPRQDPEIPGELSGGIYWHSQAGITSQVQDNITWARANGLPNFDARELITGEHSGLRSLPQMPQDNPFLAPALAAAGVGVTASDASRESQPRALSTGTSTLPRHPMNIYYNAGTYQDMIDEYNWYYTSRANGGGGICEDNPATSTCIPPLDATSNAAARASYDSYLRPVEVRNAMRFVLTNDPRPFYAHQSNLAEDGILYPVLDGVLEVYAGLYDTATSPLQRLSMTDQLQALTRMNAWQAASGGVEAYVDARGVHLPAAPVQVPLTVPAGSSAGFLSPYAGSLSGWASGAADVTLPTPAGGYLVTTPATVPAAPTIGAVTAASGAATVTWTAPANDGGSPVTGYQVRVYPAGATVPASSLPAAADATSLVVTGLTNGTGYRFDVAAANAVGTGAASALSAPVTPRATLAPVPTGVVGQAGNAAATVSWVPPVNPVGVTGYRIRAFVGTTTSVARSVAVDATRTSASLTNLVNGTGYTFDVSAITATTTRTAAGPASVRSAAVVPALTAQADGAPAVTAVAPGNGALALTWAPPVDTGAGTPTGYRVRVYTGATGTAYVRQVSLTGTGTSATVTGLTNGTGYSAEVAAIYASGAGPASARSVVAVPVAVVPGAPVIRTASSGASGGAVTATAAWGAPASTGGSPIVGYLVTATQVDSAGQPTGATSTSPLLAPTARSYAPALPAGRYSFTVVARNAVGDSPASAASNVVVAQ